METWMRRSPGPAGRTHGGGPRGGRRVGKEGAGRPSQPAGREGSGAIRRVPLLTSPLSCRGVPPNPHPRNTL